MENSVNIERPSWNAYFMQIAKDVCTRSTCSSRQVGAVIVLEKRILTTGYNGSPSGHPHCLDVGCLLEDSAGRCIRAIHAEQNAILQAAKHGIAIAGGTIFTTCRPCLVCAKLIAGVGIIRVVCDGDASEGLNKEFLTLSGVEIVNFHDNIN